MSEMYCEFFSRIINVEITDQNFFRVSEGRLHMGSLYFRLTNSLRLQTSI